MPSNPLNLDHFPQTEPAGCLAACAQIILNYFGKQISQKELSQLFEATAFGTPFSRIERLIKFGIRIDVAYEGDLETIIQAIDNGLPLITFIKTGELSYWQTNVQHALVVTGYDENSVMLYDPAFENSPQIAAIDEFLLAWLEMDYAYALATLS